MPQGCSSASRAKLDFNLKVLAQTMPSWWPSERGPDYRGILVPEAKGFTSIADALGIGVFVLVERRGHWGEEVAATPQIEHFEMRLPDDKKFGYSQHWHDRNPRERCKLPEYVPDVVTRAPAPLQLTGDLAAAVVAAAEAGRLSEFNAQFGFEKGGAFTNGIVNEPTPFRLGIMGEAGPEAIMPLRRTATGALGVQAANDPEVRKHLAALVNLQSAGNQQLLTEMRELNEKVYRLETNSRLQLQAIR